MKLTVHGKHLQVTPSLQEYAERKLGRLGNWLEEACEMHVTFAIQGHLQRHVVEVTIAFQGYTLRVEEKQEDMYSAMDLAADKLERQMRKLKGKIKHRLRQRGGWKANAAEQLLIAEAEQEPFEVARIKRVTVKPIDIEEAILQMNMLDHSFHLFLNRESNQTELVYKRDDGTYGLITTA